MFEKKIDDLFSSQLKDWELAKANYGQLERLRTRTISFGTFEVIIQFNPERIRSSSAMVDSRSIDARPCFLCLKNRPAEQRGISFPDEFTILVNPFPIFKRHLTISSDIHADQRIKNNFGTLLLLAEALPSFTVFYNGPQCGASAPDHIHFQAGSRGTMPIEKDFFNNKITSLVKHENDLDIWSWSGYMRGIITMTCRRKETLINRFADLLARLSEIQPGLPEPMINMLVLYSAGCWTVHIIPRKLHRPAQFFLTGEDQIMISPAAADLGGLLITPREEDYLKITIDDVEDIFSQVCFHHDELSDLIINTL